MKVLVVTQQDEVRRVLEETLASTDSQIFAASDLAGGLALCVEHSPALAIVDVSLAGGAALAMVHHIVASSARTSTYVIATPASFDIAGEALSLGAAGLIVAPVTGDAIMRAVAEVHARVASEERATKLASEVRDAAELVDAMTQALLVAKAGDVRALGETLLTLFLIASGARGVAVYGEEASEDGTRRRIAGFGTALELLDRYNDLELAQIATTRQGEVVGLAIDSQMFGCVLIEKPDPMRTARVHRVIEFATALLPLCALARSAIAEETTAPRSRALPAQVFERLVQRDLEAALRESREITLLCALARAGEIDTGPLGPALAAAGAAIGTSEAGDAFVLMPKTPYASARALVLDVAVPVGISSAPADGRTAQTLLQVARARAVRASKAPSAARGLRDRPLADVIGALIDAKHPDVVSLDVARETIDSMILHACRHARTVGAVEIVLARAGEAETASAIVRDAAGARAKVRNVKLEGTAHAGTLVVTVITPRAGWAIVSRERDGRTRAIHTSDASVLELLRVRLAEVA